MLTIGDVFGITAGLTGLFLTTWAMTVACNLLFPNQTERAQLSLDRNSKWTLAIGAILTIVLGFFALVFFQAPNPGGKILAWFLLLIILSLGSVGLAGAGRLAARRIQESEGTLASYPA